MRLPRLLADWSLRAFAPRERMRRRYAAFRDLLTHDRRALELITGLEEVHYGQILADWARVEQHLRALLWNVSGLARRLEDMRPGRYEALGRRFAELEAPIQDAAALPPAPLGPPWTLSLDEAADHPLLSGGKGCHLGRIQREAGLPVPPGFVVSSAATVAFLARAGLRPRLDELLARVRLDEPERLDELCREMRETLLAAPIPEDIEEEILGAAAQLACEVGEGSKFAVRSSAVGEDGELSFAGQYESLLHMDAAETAWAWKEVLASKYSPRAVAYRVRHGMSDPETPMAVLVLAMVEAAASGVCYSLDPTPGPPPHRERLGIYAVEGLGERLVDGSTVPDMYFVTRDGKGRLLRRVSQRASQEGVSARSGGVLDSATVRILADWGLRLERTFGAPQDVEWCQDAQGELFVVQSRPLAARPQPEAPPAKSAGPELPALYAGGVCASAGVGAGRVLRVDDSTRLRDVPPGSVLLTRTLPPQLASLVGRVAAVVCEGGSRASHFASVAREHGLPVIVGTRGAMQALPAGEVVTIDATRCRVHAGVVAELMTRDTVRRAAPETPLSRRLAKIMPLISRLTLTDPASENFRPENAASLHDLVRYAHEKAVEEMFQLSEGSVGLGKARRIASDLPLAFYVLDVEGGVLPPGEADVAPEEVNSAPLTALWRGLTHPDVAWSGNLQHLDWERFDQISGGVVSLKDPSLASFAVVAPDYAHAMIRFGYHFAVVDALAGDAPEANYVSFRFKGGGAAFDQRLLRLQFLQEVLVRAGFENQTRGDLLDARFARQGREAILQRVEMLGVLLGKTRLMDMGMRDVGQVRGLVEEFFRGYEPS